MSKQSRLPKKGQIAVAEYVISGKVKKTVELGVVTKATKKSFHCKNEAGETIERQYNFGASNGLRLKGFKDAEEEKEVESKNDTAAEEAAAEEEE